jgi:hypothetical protein
MHHTYMVTPILLALIEIHSIVVKAGAPISSNWHWESHCLLEGRALNVILITIVSTIDDNNVLTDDVDVLPSFVKVIQITSFATLPIST